MKYRMLSVFLSALVLALGAGTENALAFPKPGTKAGDCRDCHHLTREEAQKLLAPGGIDNVADVEPGPFKGVWEVVIVKGGKKYPLYVDYSKTYLINGQIIRIGTRENITGARYESLNVITTDPSKIPLGDALVVGKPTARRKVIVFSDPECHFCGKLHEELKTVTAKDPDVAFYIKLFSRNNSPPAAEKARAIVCSRSLTMLEDAYAGRPVPVASCASKAPEETFALTEKIGIRGTPAMVLPDGRVVSGYRDAAALRKLLAPPSPAAKDPRHRK